MWYECDSRFIPAHHQPAALIDLALSRGIDSHVLLRGSGLFHEDITRGSLRISPRQYLQLIHNARQLLGEADTSFLYGQRLLPGHYDDASLSLRHASHLMQALEQLCDLHALLMPLLRPRMILEGQWLHLYWTDSCGVGPLRRFLDETLATAIIALARRQGGQRLPWQIRFAGPAPAHVEQYWVHLSEEVRFDATITMMSLERQWLHAPWPEASHIAQQACRHQALQQRAALDGPISLLDALHDHLDAHLREPLSLDRVAAAFGMSPASLKRRLNKHGTHFQEQLDRVRMHKAIYLHQMRGYSNEDVARFLGYSDLNNYRRSFKRWTGLLPSQIERWQTA